MRADDDADRGGAFVERVSLSYGVEGVLSGSSLAVKDNIEVEGRAFTAGHPLFAARKGRTTAPIVDRLLRAGAHLVGMTTTDAGGFGVTGRDVRNPAFPDRIIGGSSSGSAAAVSAGFADLALGTDTAGSLRIPAACVGVIGFKASHAAVDLAGVWPLARSFDATGFFARDWTLLRWGAEALLSHHRASSIEGGREHGPWTFACDDDADRRYDATVRRAFDVVRARLIASGHRLVAVAMPDRAEFVEAFSRLVLSEAKTFHDNLSACDRDRLGAAAQAALNYADRSLTAEKIAAAGIAVAAVRDAVLPILCDVDALLAPTLPIDVPHVGATKVRLGTRDVSVLHALVTETCVANLCGAPAVALPCPMGAEAVPLFSLCLTGAPGRDLYLLDVATDVSRCLQDVVHAG